MKSHTLVSVMTTGGGLSRRYVCECGESGPAVLDEGAARGEHHRHARSRQLMRPLSFFVVSRNHTVRIRTPFTNRAADRAAD